MQVAAVPENSERTPKLATSDRRSGIIAPMPPIMMPTLPRLAKPHSAVINMSCERGLKLPGGICARFTSEVSATSTTSMAMMLISNRTPAAVPRTMASMAPVAGSSVTNCADGLPAASNGIMIAATARPAGVLITEAIRMKPSALGMIGPRMLA
jgi:hypothetical protein